MKAFRTVRFLSLKPQQHLIRRQIEDAFSDALDGAQYIMGAQLEKFEQQFADYTGARYCVGTGSGLDALMLALKALNLKPDDEVIVPANTYHATWLAVANIGARIVPVEPDQNTYNLDARNVKNALTDRTKVIIPVHLYGQPCDMGTLTQIANDHKLFIVEDNAQAHGASWKGRKTGSWGTVNATSFYPTKNLGALGDGGAVTTSDSKIADFVRSCRNYGSSSKTAVEMIGINSRLDELQAAFLNVKLKFLDQWNQERMLLAARYTERLKPIEGISVPSVLPDAFHVYHLYVIKAKNRDGLKAQLASAGIETMIHYPIPPHHQKPYKKLIGEGREFPVTEKLASTILSIPLYPGMSDDDLDYVCEAIDAFYR